MDEEEFGVRLIIFELIGYDRLFSCRWFVFGVVDFFPGAGLETGFGEFELID